ncbi:hypothetical protein FBU31_001132 [Coemansia sp. 'formosensis']|nr:hypothetical protein FBU31_001132 [Coemansia sp. 'formosensis']
MDMTDEDCEYELHERSLRFKRRKRAQPIDLDQPDTLNDSDVEEDEDDKGSDSGEDADSNVNADADSNADSGTESDVDANSDTDEDAVSNEDENADSDDGADAYTDSDEDANADKDSNEETNTDTDSDADADSDSAMDEDDDEDMDDPFVLEADISAFMQLVNQMSPLIVEGDSDEDDKDENDDDVDDDDVNDDDNADDYDMIRPNLNKTTDPYVLRANITAFVQRIRQMVPLVDDIDVRPRRFLLSSECSYLYSNLVTQLFQLSKHATYNDREWSSVELKLQPNQICNLEEIGDFTHLYFGTESDQSPFVQLAQRSAPTLRSLHIGHSSYSDVGDFILEAKGGYVSYPRLLTLCLMEIHNSDHERFSALPGAVPFPSLRRLHMDITYPFTDDTIFRGNAATLEHLKMRLDYHSYNAVSEHNVFTPGSHPKLSCVDITFPYDMMLIMGATIADRLEYVLNIGSGATVRTIDGLMDDEDMVQALYVFDDFACIRVLSLPHLRMDLWDVIDLIKSLPLLSDLITSPPLIEDLSDDYATEEPPEFMISEFAKLSERFRCWTFIKEGLVGDIKNVWAILLLALVCPNFDYAAPVPSEREVFMRLMEATIAIDCFQKYVPRLRRLLYSGWNGKQD